jgi:hypothetical protein
MNNPLLKRLRGYQKAPRDRFVLLTQRVLNHTEFLVYEFCIAITDWDLNHETYGSFEATNLQIALILGWKDDSTVSRIRKSLINKGVFHKKGERIFVDGFENWQLRSRTSANIQPNTANKQEASVSSQEQSANLQEIQPVTPTYSLVSFKGNVGFLRSDEEYQRMFNESPNSLSIEDMKWIDQNVYETEQAASKI